jgi:hypothetical protein
MSMKENHIHGYDYGAADIPTSPVTLQELEQLKISAGFTSDTERYLRMAGAVLAPHVQQIVQQWRSGIIAAIPHLARHSRSLSGDALAAYLGASNLRFEQWIEDTCLRPYDQAWLNYQHEIALRHTSLRKNQTDRVESTPFVPLHDAVAFVAVMNKTIKPWLAGHGHSEADIEAMHAAWCASLQLQMALWLRTYAMLANPAAEL